VELTVLGEIGADPLPRENFRHGRRTPQAGVEVERKWARADYRVPGTAPGDQLVQIRNTER
jgi:formate dehydrogenase major subunit